jgi:hypothetical protein
VDYRRTDADTGATIRSSDGCSSVLVPDLPAGNYRLAVEREGYSLSYKLGIKQA